MAAKTETSKSEAGLPQEPATSATCTPEISHTFAIASASLLETKQNIIYMPETGLRTSTGTDYLFITLIFRPTQPEVLHPQAKQPPPSSTLPAPIVTPRVSVRSLELSTERGRQKGSTPLIRGCR
ncbi:MAG: hypothetical protein K2W95_32980 [Candidatus Obscuribacterales bacterium]|nr:hypothetical protein [Candidatus Obscuribacterales bacterium]